MQPDVPAQHHFQRLFGVTRELMCVLRPDGAIVLVNPALEKTLGWPMAELAATNVLDVLHFDDIGRVFQTVRRLKHEPSVEGVEVRLLTRRKSYIPVRLDVSSSSSGAELYIVGHPIGGEVAADESVQTLNSALGAPSVAIESLIPEIGKWHIDVQTGDVVWSDSMYPLFGYEKGQFVPDRHTAFERMRDTDKAAFFEAMQQGLKQYRGERVAIPTQDGIVVSLPDGRTRHLQSTVAIVGNRQHPTHMHGYVVDVSDRHVHAKESQKQAQQNSQMLKEFAGYKKAIALIQDPICLLDQDGVVVYANPAVSEKTGYESEDIVGKAIGIWAVEGPDRDYYAQMVEAAVSTKTQQVSILRSRNRDGREYMSEVRMDPIENEQGDVIGLVEHERIIS